MSWRKYNYWPELRSPTHLHSVESPMWVFRGCYWRWRVYSTPEISREEEID